MAWSLSDIPPLDGKRMIVTGGNTGIGYHQALQLALHGAEVTIACRNHERATAATQKMAKAGATVKTAQLDLSDFRSIDAFLADTEPVDVLINNAGIMAPPRAITKQGHESQWGTNVVGHARLTMGMLDRIKDRVVMVSSIAHRAGRIDFDNLRGEKEYNPWREYQQSKLGDLVFALELQRRLDRRDSKVRSVAAHPGISRTELARNISWAQILMFLPVAPFLQSAARGAEPEIRAAVDDVPGGSYWGPGKGKEYRGPANEARISKHALDEELGQALWKELEQDFP